MGARPTQMYVCKATHTEIHLYLYLAMYRTSRADSYRIVVELRTNYSLSYRK